MDKAKEKFLAVMWECIERMHNALQEYLEPYKDNRLETQKAKKALWDDKCVTIQILKALQRAYPEPAKEPPVIAPPPSVPVVKSVKEAAEKGYRAFVIITPGPSAEVPREWLDPSIKWSGHSVEPLVPTIEDRNNPARMTEDGETYYRE